MPSVLAQFVFLVTQFITYINCYYLIPCFIPFCISATAKAFNNPLCLKVFEYPAYHINTNIGTFPQYIGNTEITGEIFNGILNHCCLFTLAEIVPDLSGIQVSIPFWSD